MNEMMQENHIVNFHGQDLLLVDHAGTPFVAMRPVVDGMGLNWKGQHERLVTQRVKFNCVDMHTTGSDGKRREMLCIPLQKLPLWLATVNPNKITNPTIRARVETYQQESAFALYEYWFHGGAVNPRATDEQIARLEAKIDAMQRHIELFGCRTRYGEISTVNGLPRVVNCHGYWRTDRRMRNIGQTMLSFRG